jgi:hypothetical protein
LTGTAGGDSSKGSSGVEKLDDINKENFRITKCRSAKLTGVKRGESAV